jgi:LmbE family N-acetylglucosaminyl deacetylase
MTELSPMPRDWERALVIMAHPDDPEYGASSAVAGWTDEGRSVAYVLASRGEAGIDGMAPEQVGPLREREQVAAAAVVGVETVEFLDYPDGLIEYGIPLRRDLAAAIRRHRPELVITVNHHEVFAGGFPNMADHRHVGLAALDAVRDAGNRWIFREGGLEPWAGVRWAAVSDSPHATHAVDIAATLDRGVASLRAHRVYLDSLQGALADPAKFLPEMARRTGEQFGGGLAASFELVSFT